MKKRDIFFVLLVVILNSLFLADASGAWRIEMVDSGSVGAYNDIAVDSSGNVHISYYDGANRAVKYATNASGSWRTETVGSVGNSVFLDTILYLDSSDNPHIVYYDFSSDSLIQATRASGVWQLQTFINLGIKKDYRPSIAVDSSGNIHIAYCDTSVSPRELKYVSNVSGAWQTKTADSDCSYVALAVNSTGEPHIVYFYYAYVNGVNYQELRYATIVSGTWQIETISSNAYFAKISLSLDVSGNVHTIFQEEFSGLKYATNASGSWSTEKIDDGSISNSSISIDSSGNAYVSYYDDFPNKDLRYATNATGSWRTEAVDTLGNVGEYNAIAVDSSGNVHISYFDEFWGYLKYATTSSAAQSPLTVSKSASPVPAASGSDLTYTIDYGNAGDSALTGVVISDTVPWGTTFVSADRGGVESAGTVTWDVGNLAAGAAGRVSFTVSVSPSLADGTIIRNSDYSVDSDQTAQFIGSPVDVPVYSINYADVNSDGVINVLDAIKVLRMALGLN